MSLSLDTRFSTLFPPHQVPAGYRGETTSFPIIVDNPSFFSALAALLTGPTIQLQDNTRVNTWFALVAYTRWRVVHALSNRLPQRFAQATFNFFRKTLAGQQAPLPRNLTCTRLADNMLGDIVGRLYVERAFPGNSKVVANQLIDFIKAAFAEQVQTLSWLDAPSKVAALQKLGNISQLVGFPTHWDQYNSVTFSPFTFMDNMRNIQAYLYVKGMADLTKPVDKTRFAMTPATVNAYYDPTLNSINFPAGILQPSFFKADYPAAANFGGIGSVMGHELTHGFDDSGSQYDGQGLLRDWWSSGTKAEFNDRTACLAQQYARYPVGDLFVNGNLTLGENIADSGGLSLAWTAYHNYQKAHPDPDWASVSRISSDQLFFLSFAQTWCSVYRPAYAKQLVLTDPHSPPKYRVNGVVPNFQPFADTFQCAAGTPMNPVHKCLLWYE
jgi:putative endopeptidase